MDRSLKLSEKLFCLAVDQQSLPETDVSKEVQEAIEMMHASFYAAIS